MHIIIPILVSVIKYFGNTFIGQGSLQHDMPEKTGPGEQNSSSPLRRA